MGTRFNRLVTCCLLIGGLLWGGMTMQIRRVKEIPLLLPPN